MESLRSFLGREPVIILADSLETETCRLKFGRELWANWLTLVDQMVIFVANLFAEFIDFWHDSGGIVLLSGDRARKDVLIREIITKETSDHTLFVIVSRPGSFIKNALSINLRWSLFKNSLV